MYVRVYLCLWHTHYQCQELGQLISQEIDAVKTGQYVQFDPDTLRPPSSPQSGCVSEIHRASTILQEMRALLQAFVIAELDQHDRQKLSVGSFLCLLIYA